MWAAVARLMMTGSAVGAGFVAESSDSRGRFQIARPRLLDQVRNALRLRHYSRRTERAYVGWIRRFILFHGKWHPREMGAEEVTQSRSGSAVLHRPVQL